MDPDTVLNYDSHRSNVRTTSPMRSQSESAWLQPSPSMPLASVIHMKESQIIDPIREQMDPYSENHQCGRTAKYASDTMSSFNEMTDDIRRSFLGWFNKLETDLCSQWDTLRHERETFEKHRIAETNRIAAEREQEMKALDIQRAKFQAEQKAALKHIAVEREETRRKLDEERLSFLNETDQIKAAISREKEIHRGAVEMFESEKMKVVDAEIAAQTVVEINIGGTVFESSKHTVSQQKGSFLDNLFSGIHKVMKDKNGRIFLDRDPHLFRSILNYLRNPSVLPHPTNEGHSMELIEEAAYYGIRYFQYPLIYAMGGNNGIDYLSSVEMLDVEDQSWKLVKKMMTERAYCGSGVVGGRLFAYGGQNHDYKVLYDTEVYDVLRGDWFAAPSLNVARRSHASIAAGNRLFAIGGYDGTAITSSVEMLDERLKNWNNLAPMPKGRSASAAVLSSNNQSEFSDILVVGGTDGQRLRSIMRYDMRADKWETADFDLLDVRSACNSVVHQGQMYTLGGLNEMHQMNNTMEVIDLTTQSGKAPSRYLTGCGQPRLDSSSVSVSQSFFTIGGHLDNTPLDIVEFYQPELSSWQPAPRLNVARYGHTSAVCTI